MGSEASFLTAADCCLLTKLLVRACEINNIALVTGAPRTGGGPGASFAKGPPPEVKFLLLLRTFFVVDMQHVCMR